MNGVSFRVVVVQRRLTHYRVPLFQQLKERLATDGIELRLLVGEETAEEKGKRDKGELDWATPVPTRYFAGDRLCWQPFGHLIRDADLVIVTQENKLLYNHWLLARPRRFKLAFWGHGRNMQSSVPHGLKERFKAWETRLVDWWFAYTQLSADVVAGVDFPRERITVLNNSIDTRELQRHRSSVNADEVAVLRADLGLDAGPVGVFIGSLYADKRLDFLFAAADKIRARVPEFGLLIIGDGPLREEIATQCAERPWAHWVGAKYGREKALFMNIGDVILNPGMVGLGLLDAFVMERVIFTTQCSIHSPEISYLENGVNGIVTRDDLGDYVDTVVSVLESPPALALLRKGCAAGAAMYSIENMVVRFAEGIGRALR